MDLPAMGLEQCFFLHFKSVNLHFCREAAKKNLHFFFTLFAAKRRKNFTLFFYTFGREAAKNVTLFYDFLRFLRFFLHFWPRSGRFFLTLFFYTFSPRSGEKFYTFFLHFCFLHFCQNLKKNTSHQSTDLFFAFCAWRYLLSRETRLHNVLCKCL